MWASEKKQTLKKGGGGKTVGVQGTTLGWRLELSSWVLPGCCSLPEGAARSQGQGARLSCDGGKVGGGRDNEQAGKMHSPVWPPPPQAHERLLPDRNVPGDVTPACTCAEHQRPPLAFTNIYLVNFQTAVLICK